MTDFSPTLPLTLTLSPPAGRGDVPYVMWRETERLRHVPFAPFTGRRCRQADEGHAPGQATKESIGGANHVSHP
ncbi:hypothetical protein EFR84_20670 [Rhizobium chutanense]|uniref:Uncharacterized protein n=1 Tax=Rhizobium chutanense TaxID=2035448 RepID=A0A3S0XP02_9HYPH|nr:hypothetical protein EFR84_20670 [Rhizobium chutanense]